MNIEIEQKYKHAYNLLQGIMESPKNISIFALDRNYQYLVFNKNHQTITEQIWGDKIEIGSCFLTFIKNPLNREKTKVNCDRALAGEAFTIIEEYKDLLHERHWHEMVFSPLKNDDGDVIGLAVFLTDITERKNAEIKIAKETIRRRILIEQSSDGIVIIDKDGHVIEANLKFAEMLGYSLKEISSLHQCEWDAKFTPDELTDMRNQVDEKGDHFETTHRRKDATLYDVDISSNAAMFGEQKLIFCVCRDITERKQTEKELLKAKLEAESASRAKSQFIATMSHELRTPLTSVIGFSDVLSTNTSEKLTEKEQVYIDNIRNSGEQLLNIINDILELSKIDSGKIELECEKFFVKEVFDEILPIMTQMASKKNIDISVNNEIPFETIFADRVRVKRIMYNLLSNAIKFSPDNRIVSVIVDKSDSTIKVSVSDMGIGIPKDRLKDIFNPFTQVDSSDTRKYGGTGLGLAIVKQLVELHKGIIWVESEEGKGSTFSFTLPMKELNK
ncbi:PAS domain-containing protein [Methanolobus vulcani]|uniref:histidine kinase n=1 Tax=Methanolobus vulcani TaxID=38026 RepID=A0A7Z8P394_9EURY|nr:PAS domain-containing protein [Methanolobus vulcani]TQD29208.1 PAS domain S-box protein [Methanolobus vulcani]